MRFTMFALATASAVLVLATLTSPASATTLSSTTEIINETWTTMHFAVGFGTVECEVFMNKRRHSRVSVKGIGSLIGYITAARVIRCDRGGATVLRETLPWHEQYSSFAGALPTIRAIRTWVVGASYRISEPVFAIECLSRTSITEPAILTYNRNITTGATTSAAISGTIRCSSITSVLEGTSSSITAHTVTLI